LSGKDLKPRSSMDRRCTNPPSETKFLLSHCSTRGSFPSSLTRQFDITVSTALSPAKWYFCCINGEKNHKNYRLCSSVSRAEYIYINKKNVNM
jgi:hypothetical protein